MEMSIGIAEQQKVGKQGRDDSIKQFSIQLTLYRYFHVILFRPIYI